MTASHLKEEKKQKNQDFYFLRTPSPQNEARFAEIIIYYVGIAFNNNQKKEEKILHCVISLENLMPYFYIPAKYKSVKANKQKTF